MIVVGLTLDLQLSTSLTGSRSFEIIGVIGVGGGAMVVGTVLSLRMTGVVVGGCDRLI